MISALSDFRCKKDKDIEEFLSQKAVEYLKRRLCNTYLILDLSEFIKGKLKIEAYFTLSHKTLTVPDNFSKTRIQKIDGRNKYAKSLHFVLIGQLGKYIDDKNASDITMSQILAYADEVIKQSSDLIPCRCVLVECSDEPNVKKLYEDNGFAFLQNDGKHNQYYYLLKE